MEHLADAIENLVESGDFSQHLTINDDNNSAQKAGKAFNRVQGRMQRSIDEVSGHARRRSGRHF